MDRIKLGEHGKRRLANPSALRPPRASSVLYVRQQTKEWSAPSMQVWISLWWSWARAVADGFMFYAPDIPFKFSSEGPSWTRAYIYKRPRNPVIPLPNTLLF